MNKEENQKFITFILKFIEREITQYLHGVIYDVENFDFNDFCTNFDEITQECKRIMTEATDMISEEVA